MWFQENKGFIGIYVYKLICVINYQIFENIFSKI